MNVGTIVQSICGHDQASFYVVIAVDGDFCTIADGRRRKIEKPKRKNQKHLRCTTQIATPAEYKTNLQLRKRLWELNFNSDKPCTEQGGNELGKRRCH